VLRIQFAGGIGIDCKKIVGTVHLHPVPGEEEKTNIARGQEGFEFPKLPVQLHACRVRCNQDTEAVGSQLGRQILGVVHWIL
jgi:hypothetical protein